MNIDQFSYRTLPRPGKGLYKERNSKFHSFAFPVVNEDEIKTHLDQLRKEYFDARHYCFAWILGPDKKQFRAFDDGEPNHSAGDPILGQLRSRELTDALVVVVRYFGGTKLGVSGLIAAYKSAAALALDDAGSVEKQIFDDVTLEYKYDDTTAVMRLVREFDLDIVEQDFTDSCRMRVHVPRRISENFFNRLSLLVSTGADIRFTRN